MQLTLSFPILLDPFSDTDVVTVEIMLMLLYATEMVEASEQCKAGKKIPSLSCCSFNKKKNCAGENNFLKELMFDIDDYAEELYRQSRCISKT